MSKKKAAIISLSPDWDKMLKSEGQEGAKVNLADMMPIEKDTVDFPTGSYYIGKWNSLGMAVYGNYMFAHGCEYDGGFHDGMFHGEGTLTYPMGQRLEGIWDKGRLVSYKFVFVDGLEFASNWNYCQMPDRRFYASIREGLQPADREFMTNQQPERPVEEGYYDTIDGMYEPKSMVIHTVRDPVDYQNLEMLEVDSQDDTLDMEEPWLNYMRTVDLETHDWIVEHCRKGVDEPAGYRPEFYEDWVSGRQSELDELTRKYAAQKKYSLPKKESSEMCFSPFVTSVEAEHRKSSVYAGTGRVLLLDRSKWPAKESI